MNILNVSDQSESFLSPIGTVRAKERPFTRMHSIVVSEGTFVPEVLATTMATILHIVIQVCRNHAGGNYFIKWQEFI